VNALTEPIGLDFGLDRKETFVIAKPTMTNQPPSAVMSSDLVRTMVRTLWRNDERALREAV
jgi:hypothetical protein